MNFRRELVQCFYGKINRYWSDEWSDEMAKWQNVYIEFG